jgi:hypothetical protein
MPKGLGSSHVLYNVLPTVFCLLYTLSISNFLNCSTRLYRVTSALELNKKFKPSQRQISVQSQSRQYSCQYLGCVQVTIQRKVCEIFNGSWEILFKPVDMYQWISQYISLSPHHLAFTERDVNANRYILQVILWRTLSKI